MSLRYKSIEKPQYSRRSCVDFFAGAPVRGQTQAFVNEQATKGKKSFNTLKNLKWGLSSVFAAAVKYGYIKENPVPNADLPPKGIQEEEKLPTAEHLDKLISALEEPYSTMLWLHAVAIPRPSQGLSSNPQFEAFITFCGVGKCWCVTIWQPIGRQFFQHRL